MTDVLPISRVAAIFAQVARVRWWIIAVYAMLVPGAVLLALRIPKDNTIDRMVVASDPAVAATREFHRIFPERPVALLLVESPHPLAATTVEGIRDLQAALDRVPKVTTYSALTVWDRMRPGGRTQPGAADALAAFVSGTRFFRDQGLVGDRFLAIVLALDVAGGAERDVALGRIDCALADTLPEVAGRAAITNVRRVGKPWLESWLERETAASTIRYFPLFAAFVLILTVRLYRSWRALAAILLSLAVAVLLGMAVGGLARFGFTIISSVVPLILMITVTASLIYLHSRFVDQAPGVPIERHRILALENKFLAVSASMFAAGVGFAALAVSDIRPIRQLGIWTSVGIAIGWVVCFTLYPALQVALRAPTRQQRAVSGAWIARLADALPGWSFRWRWVILASAAVLATGGLASLLGIPGLLAPMRMATDALEYVDENEPIARDTRAFSDTVLGLTSVDVWVRTPPGVVLQGGTLGALEAFAASLRRQPHVGSVVGLTAVLRLREYAAGRGDRWPDDPGAVSRMTADIEPLLLQEPALAEWVDLSDLGATYLTVTTRAGDPERFEGLELAIRKAWEEAARSRPMLASCSYRIVGTGVLEERINAQLVPTLTKSFALTFGIIFVTFLLVFRSGPARIIATVPSLFAILVMFLFMRLTGIGLNVATILIATTVLGATENDQIHFFYHFQDRRIGSSTEASLVHAVRVAGHAIVFATLINAGGFLALTISSLPPMRQFGILTSAAFAFAMLADFTALPAALWIVFRESPARHLPTTRGDDRIQSEGHP
ncbi:MAG TPA: MMPL family transporter [Vicinamibacterales bacterium]